MSNVNTQPERLDNLQRLELESTIGFEGFLFENLQYDNVIYLII
jgi:hypothetical protein